jgi:hypothetical protein
MLLHSSATGNRTHSRLSWTQPRRVKYVLDYWNGRVGIGEILMISMVMRRFALLAAVLLVPLVTPSRSSPLQMPLGTFLRPRQSPLAGSCCMFGRPQRAVSERIE